MASQHAVIVPLAFEKDGEHALFYTDYCTSNRQLENFLDAFEYLEGEDNSIELVNVSRVTYDAEHEGYTYRVNVRLPETDTIIRLYSITFDTKQEAVEEQVEFQDMECDELFLTRSPLLFLRTSDGEEEIVELEVETEAEESEAEEEDSVFVDDKFFKFTEDMKDTLSFYVGVPVYNQMMFTDEFDTFDEALEFYRNGFKEHGVIGRDRQYNADGSSVIRFGDFTLWAYDEETNENYFLSTDLQTLISEDIYNLGAYTEIEEDADYVPTQAEIEESEQEEEEALNEMESEAEETEAEEESEGEEDEFTFNLSDMRLKPYGKGHLLIPSKSDADKQLMGTKYFLGGWWMPQRNAWFFKNEFISDLMDMGAKMMQKSGKDRTGLRSKKVYWKKLERGYALVPKEDYKHYGKQEFRGGKWWKNGNAWFFTDNGRQRYIEKYGTSSSSTKAH